MVFSSIASTYSFWPSVFGRMLLPRLGEDRLAEQLGRAALAALEDARRTWSHRPGRGRAPFAHHLHELVDEPLGGARPARRGPSRVTWLPRTSTSTSGYCCSMVVSRRSCGPSSRTMATPSTCEFDARGVGARAAGELSLLVAKGAFLEGAAEHVGVHVEHGLAGGFAGVEDETELAVGVLARRVVAAGASPTISASSAGRRRRARRRRRTAASSGPPAGAREPSARCL